MAQEALTESRVKSLQPEASRIEVSDTVRPGLRIRVSPAGRKSWVFEKRVKHGAKRKHDLGTYPEVTLKAAREKALEIHLEAINGIDRVEVRAAKAAQEEKERLTSKSISAVLSEYENWHAKDLKSGKERMRALRKSLAPHQKKPSRELTNKMLQAAIDAKKVDAPVQANRLKAYFSHFASFGRARGYFEAGVGTDLQRAIRERSRERAPTLAEVRAIYGASFELGELWGPLVRLLILTAQRKQEVAALCWSEIDFPGERICLGGARAKNDQQHITHLSDPALAELQWLRHGADDDVDLIFSTTGVTPVSGFTKMKARLDALLGEDFERWTLHDLRTGFATTMADAGENESVVDRILNHSATGSAPSAVARVYNRARMLPQRKRVLNRWAEMVTSPDADNIVRIA